VVVADEQERHERRQLPEPEQHDQVVGQDEAEHRPGEQHQQPDEAAEPVADRGEVAGGVGEDQHPDAGDEQDEQRREPVEAQVHVHVQLGHPRHGLGHGVAPQDARRLRGQPHERGGGRQGRDRERAALRPPPGGQDAEAGGGMGEDERDHGASLTPVTPLLGVRRGADGAR
jgi:hypothetical protein